MNDQLIIDLRSSDFGEDRYSVIESMRAQSFYGRTNDGAVVFFNQEDATEVLSCKNFRFTFNLIDTQSSPYLATAIQNELLNMHGEQHQRLSRLLKMALRDRIVDAMRTSIEEIIEKLIDDFPDEGRIDFCAAFADPLPALVLGPMFGIPYTSAEGLNEWIKIGGRKIDALQSGVDIEKVENANRNLHEYLRNLLAERRENLGDDLFSELIQAEIDGDRLSEDELVYLASELAAAGVDTTRAQLPLILNVLFDHPDQMQVLNADPGLALRAVDEGMRFAPLPWALPHAATHDFTYKGIDFKEGDLAFVLVPAANRDPVAIIDAQKFDITRRARNFSFGGGMHSCPAAQIARIEMSFALKALVEKLTVLERAEDPVWEEGQIGRGLRQLWINVTKS